MTAQGESVLEIRLSSDMFRCFLHSSEHFVCFRITQHRVVW